MFLTVNQITSQHKKPAIKKNKQVVFQSKNNLLEENKNKNKNKLPAILLTALSVGVGILGYIKFRKSDKIFKEQIVKNLEEAQIHLKNIFGKDITLDEVNNFILKHKELNKIGDNKEYYKKLFDQLKCDFKVENKNLSLKLMEKPIQKGSGMFEGYTEALTREIGATSSNERAKTFATLFHEFRHVKQNELMYRADSARLVRAKVLELEKSNNASWQSILNDCAGNKNKAREMVKNEVENIYRKNWGHLKPVSTASEEYKLGIKYLENEENRIPPGEHYYEQILEKEAQFVGKTAEKLFRLIENFSK